MRFNRKSTWNTSLTLILDNKMSFGILYRALFFRTHMNDNEHALVISAQAGKAGFAPWGHNSDVLSNHWHMCTTCDVHLTHYILNGDTGFCKIPNVTIVSRFACDVPLAEPLIIHPVPRSMETDLVSPRPSTVLCWPCPISTTPISTGGPTFGTVPAKWS